MFITLRFRRHPDTNKINSLPPLSCCYYPTTSLGNRQFSLFYPAFFEGRFPNDRSTIDDVRGDLFFPAFSPLQLKGPKDMKKKIRGEGDRCWEAIPEFHRRKRGLYTLYKNEKRKRKRKTENLALRRYTVLGSLFFTPSLRSLLT